MQDRDGAVELILATLEKATQAAKLWADGGCAGPKLERKLARQGLGPVLEIVQEPKEIKGFTVLYRRWAVDRTFAWKSRCRLLAKDHERSLESSLARTQLAACRFQMRRVAREISV